MANSRLNNGTPISSQLKLHNIKKIDKHKNKYLGKSSQKLNKCKRIQSNKKASSNQKKNKYFKMSSNIVPKEIIISKNSLPSIDPLSKIKYNENIKENREDQLNEINSIPIVTAHFEPYHNNYQAHDSNIYTYMPYKQFINADYIFRDMDANEIRYQNSKNIPDPKWSIVKDFMDDGQKANNRERKKTQKQNMVSDGTTSRMGEISYIEENVSDEAYTRYHEKYETIEREYKKRDREWRKLMEDSGTASTTLKRKSTHNVIPTLSKDNARTRHSTADIRIQEIDTNITRSPKNQNELKMGLEDNNFTTKYPRPSHWPSIYDVECLEIINDISDKQKNLYPLAAFGHQVPQIEEAPYKLPWK